MRRVVLLLMMGSGSLAFAQQQVVVVPPANQAVQPVVTESEWPNHAMIAGGLVTFGISYGAAVAVAATSDHKGDDPLYVPIAGPWLDLGNRGACERNCDGETTNKVLLVVDGVFQGAGAISVIGGILAPRPRTYVSDTSVHVVPVSLGHAAPGLTAYGQF